MILELLGSQTDDGVRSVLGEQEAANLRERERERARERERERERERVFCFHDMTS